MRFLFLHGGPGFNSFAEEAILGPLLSAAGHQVRFWNEPSRLRPRGEVFEAADAYRRWLASSERCLLGVTDSGPAHVIAFSFAVHAAAHLARSHPARVASVLLAAPSADPFGAFRNVLALAAADFAAERPDAAASLRDCIARTRTLMDDAMREGLPLALADPRLFSHYWVDPARADAAFRQLSSPEAQYDVESLFAVLGDFQACSSRGAGEAMAPTLALFADRDPIAPIDQQEVPLRALFAAAIVERFEDCSHCLHLDQPERFVRRLDLWAASVHTARSS